MNSLTQCGSSLGEGVNHTAMVNALLFSADGKTLFSAAGEPTVRIWDTEHWEVRCVLPIDFSAGALELLDPRTLVAGGSKIQVWRGAFDDPLKPERADGNLPKYGRNSSNFERADDVSR